MDFNTLLQQAQRLSNEAAANGSELPPVERTISQVLQATQELHSRVTQTGAKDIQAHILLGSKGIDLPKITQKLEQLSSRKTFEPLTPIGDTDIQSFLKNEKENAILSVIDEVNKNLAESSQRLKWNSLKSEWNQEKVRILNAMIGPSQDFIDISRLPEQTVLHEKSVPRSRLSRFEMLYAATVCEYNEIIFKGGYRPNLVQKFAQVAEQFEDTRINDMWHILKYMVDVTPISRNIDPIKTRQQTPQFIAQAKRYLERRYKVYMASIVCGNLRRAERGGIPTTYNLVAAFVGVTFNPNNTIGLVDIVQGKPLWPLVYYCMRCGELAPAQEFLREAGGNSNEDFIQVLEDKINNPNADTSKHEATLKLQYSNKIRNSTDAYKKAAYCILLGCEPNESHSEVARTIDDFLWIQLSLLRANKNRDTNIEQLTYAGLQSLILEKYGENHFNAHEQAHVYFQVLALTGQFEAAIEFLARTEANRSHAVHMALALNELCMLGGPRNVQQPLLSIDIEDAKPMRRLNLARLVMLYVKAFERTDTAEALQYYYFLRNFHDPIGRNLFLVCVCDLAVETGAYDLIFGKLVPNECGKNEIVGGLFEQFSCAEYETRTVAAMVADELIKRGMLERAIHLYDIANIHNKALKNLSILVSQVVHQVSKPGSMRERLSVVVDMFSARLDAHHIEVEPNIRNTFNLLKDLLIFFDYFHELKYVKALDVLSRTKLVPMCMNELDECLMNFRRLGGEICKVFPDVMLAAMDIIYAQFKEIKGYETGAALDTGREQLLKELRDKAKALNNMAATVPYRMPGDTNKRLVQIEILMH